MNDIAERILVDRQTSTSERQRQTAALKKENELTRKLLKFEADVRSIDVEREIYLHFCNAPREFINFEQSFVGLIKQPSGKFRLQFASSIPAVDRSAPFSHWLEKIINRMITQTGGQEQFSFCLPDYCDANDEELLNFPYKNFVWNPLIHKDRLFGGYIVVRDGNWTDSEYAMLTRLSNLYVNSLAASKGHIGLAKKRLLPRTIMKASFLFLLALGFLPVPITALAPFEVTPEDPFVLSAPYDGVVMEIVPSKGGIVTAGDTMIIFDDVHLQNENKLAEQRADIALARFERTSQAAIADYRVKRDIEVNRAEFELAKSESSYTMELLKKSRLVAPVNGVAIYSDKTDWEGKPVAAGQAIVSIADPEKIGFTIDLPVRESIVLEQGARIKVFLDSAPTQPIEAVLTEASYSAEADKRDVLSYKLRAELAERVDELPRIGVQGTAQIYGEKATLAYTLFRRPYAALRQFTGW